jgi:light-regulated signal transduction histidine kinase (bacteriophytochrome)
MEQLIDALLEFSRVGRADLGVRRTDLNDVIKDVVQMMRPTMVEQNVKLQVDPLPTMDCDAVRVRQLLQNLISNAIKYNENDEKLIEIGYREQACSPSDDPPSLEKPRPFLFYVRDNGIGIREKHLSSIFRIFTRLHGRDKYGGGTGAGLTFAKQIVERHGGKIWAESTVGEGTTFFFTLQQD